MIARTAELASVDDLLAALEGASGTTARLIDIPPLEVEALKQSLADLRDDAGGFPSPRSSPACLRRPRSRRRTARRRACSRSRSAWASRSSTPPARSAGSTCSTRTRRTCEPLRDEGFAAYALRVGRPYAQAVAAPLRPATTDAHRAREHRGGKAGRSCLNRRRWRIPTASAHAPGSSSGNEVEIFRLDALQERFDVLRLPVHAAHPARERPPARGRRERHRRRRRGGRGLGGVGRARRRRSRSRRVASCSRTSPACPRSSTSPRCETRCGTSAAIPVKINPQLPAELVIDHSVQVDEFATRLAIFRNAELEFERNRERYAFLRWGQGAFADFKVVPPSTGIVHQVNLEFLARVVDDARRRRLPRHARRDRLAHDDDQRARRARLGRRRDRGRGGDARRGDLDARPAGGRLQAHGRAARGRDRDRPRAHGDADPA